MRALLLGMVAMPVLALQLASYKAAQGSVITDPTYLGAVKATFVLPVVNPLTDQVPASLAFLESGNDGASTLPLLASLFGGSDWTLVGKSDDEPIPFPFVSNVTVQAGTLLIANPPGSLDGPFAITLKAGNSYAAFFFDASVEDVIAFEFSTILAQLLNNGGNFAALSHASLYVPRVPPPDPDGEPSVPEPASLAVFSLLAMAGGAGYWRSKQAQPAAGLTSALP